VVALARFCARLWSQEKKRPRRPMTISKPRSPCLEIFKKKTKNEIKKTKFYKNIKNVEEPVILSHRLHIHQRLNISRKRSPRSGTLGSGSLIGEA
jgi:hypothetical protein